MPLVARIPPPQQSHCLRSFANVTIMHALRSTTLPAASNYAVWSWVGGDHKAKQRSLLPLSVSSSRPCLSSSPVTPGTDFRVITILPNVLPPGVFTFSLAASYVPLAMEAVRTSRLGCTIQVVVNRAPYGGLVQFSYLPPATSLSTTVFVSATGWVDDDARLAPIVFIWLCPSR